MREVQRDLLPDLLRDSPRTFPGDLRCDMERDDRRSGLAASDPFAGVASTVRGAYPRPLTTSTPTRTGDPRELLPFTRNSPHRQARQGVPPRPQGRRGRTTGAYRLVRTRPGSVDPLSWTRRSRRWLITPAVRCWSSPGRAPARPPRSSRRSPPASPGAATRPASLCSPSAARPRWSCATGWPPGSVPLAARRPPRSTPSATHWSAPTRTPISSPNRCGCSPDRSRTSPSAICWPASSNWSSRASRTSAGPTNCGPA